MILPWSRYSADVMSSGDGGEGEDELKGKLRFISLPKTAALIKSGRL
jgi:hypothetical protein